MVNLIYLEVKFMTLGEKLLRARQESGLSQRQLCGDVITRNMLSQIEHGTARPSMDTLQYLASRLGKSVSYFLEDSTPVSPNQQLMDHARRAFAAGDYSETRLVLAGFQQPDSTFQWEYRYLSAMSALLAGEQAINEEKHIYARELLQEAMEAGKELPGIPRQCLLLLGKLPNAPLAEICRQLPSLDEELLLRAEAALADSQPDRALELLKAMEHPTSHAYLVQGLALLGGKNYAAAVKVLLLAQEDYPVESYPALEICYRELGDFRQAYHYAAAQLRK